MGWVLSSTLTLLGVSSCDGSGCLGKVLFLVGCCGCCVVRVGLCVCVGQCVVGLFGSFGSFVSTQVRQQVAPPDFDECDEDINHMRELEIVSD